MKTIVYIFISCLLFAACKSSSKSIFPESKSPKTEKIGTGNYKAGYDDGKGGDNGIFIFN